MATSDPIHAETSDSPERRVTLQSALVQATHLLQRINRLEPLSGSAPRDLELLMRELERTVIALCEAGATQAVRDRRAAVQQTSRSRRSLIACEVALRIQAAEVASYLATVCGRAPDAGVYHPDAGRRSSPGAWMSMRSSP